MGTWGADIFDDDTAMDIRDNFFEYLDDGLSVNEATDKIIEEYKDELEEEQIESTVFLALASLQLEKKSLDEDIGSKAIQIIDNDIGLEAWEEAGEQELKERLQVLHQLKKALSH